MFYCIYIFIYMGNTCVIVTGSCLVCDVNKDLGNDDHPASSILDTHTHARTHARTHTHTHTHTHIIVM